MFVYTHMRTLSWFLSAQVIFDVQMNAPQMHTPQSHTILQAGVCGSVVEHVLSRLCLLKKQHLSMPPLSWVMIEWV